MKRRHPHAARAVTAPKPTDGVRPVWMVLVLAALLAYANSFSNPFLLDDKTSVTTNAQIRTLWPLSMPLSPPDETPVAGRPLVNLTFALNYALGGLDARGYHLGNLAIHLLAALVLLALVRRVLTLGALAPAFGARATALAAACALIWGLHPLHTEIVNYVSQRTTALMGLFYLLTLYCSVRAAEHRSGRWTAAAVAACAAGMASKETMVTAPLLVLVFDRIFLFRSLRDAVRRRAALYGGLAATWAFLAVLMATRARTTVGFDEGVTAWGYLLNQFPLIVHYLRLAFWPDALVVDYGVPQMLELADVRSSVVVVVVLAGITAAALRHWPHAGFAGGAFFILLSPTSSIVPIVSEVGAERRMYLPLAALVVLGVCLAYRATGAVVALVQRRIPWQPGRRLFYTGYAAVALVCAAMCVRIVTRNLEYRSSVELASVTVERRPHGRAYFMLANALLDAGREDEAIRYFRQSGADFAGGNFALGTLIVARDPEAGIVELESFLRKMPDHPAAPGVRGLIGLAQMRLGRFDRAAAELQVAVQSSPADLAARAALGEALFRTGRAEDALPHLRMAAAARPSGRLHNLIGAALAETGRLEDARAAFERAVRLDPDDAAAANNLEHVRQLAAERGR
jgi:Flp pilus assembly protein TadD